MGILIETECRPTQAALDRGFAPEVIGAIFQGWFWAKVVQGYKRPAPDANVMPAGAQTVVQFPYPHTTNDKQESWQNPIPDHNHS